MLCVEKKLWLLFFCVLVVQTLSWSTHKTIQAEWANVPPVPSKAALEMSFLGDPQLAYRASGVAIQNMGDTGGRTAPLKDYDYDKLSQWFFVLNALDPQSNFIPYLASFYYGGLEGQGEKLRPLIGYLRVVGQSTENQKWRWLARASYLARYKLKDIDYAYEMALELAALAAQPNSKLPIWTQQMPAFILNEKGDKEAAYTLLLEILKSSAENLHPSEVTNTIIYICESLLTEQEAAQNELCNP